MGVYAVTGGSSGIGAAVVELLKKDGNEVINIDLKKRRYLCESRNCRGQTGSHRWSIRKMSLRS